MNRVGHYLGFGAMRNESGTGAVVCTNLVLCTGETRSALNRIATRAMKNSSESARGQGNETPNLQPLHAYRTFVERYKLTDDASSETIYQVYQDLVRIRKWSNVRICQRAKRPYIAGSAARAFDSVFGDTDGDRTQAVVPVSVWESLSAAEMYDLCAECVHPESGEKLRCVTMAFVDDDSTTAYYRMMNRWEEIVDENWKARKVRTEEGVGTEERDEREQATQSEDGSSLASDSDTHKLRDAVHVMFVAAAQAHRGRRALVPALRHTELQ
ncbi:tRNA-splicing endonuclease subunit Sen15 [Gracilaria domingensis]|nr:tRNA-splicing endonuclease subunit Sen15 [Gracilaria domingensis]